MIADCCSDFIKVPGLISHTPYCHFHFSRFFFQERVIVFDDRKEKEKADTLLKVRTVTKGRGKMATLHVRISLLDYK